jgi:hypothetical protein
VEIDEMKKFLDEQWNLSVDQMVEESNMDSRGTQIPGTTAARKCPHHNTCSENNVGWSRPAMNCVRDDCSWTDPRIGIG